MPEEQSSGLFRAALLPIVDYTLHFKRWGFCFFDDCCIINTLTIYSKMEVCITAKSKIIKELANGDVTLDVALNRLLIIATDIQNEPLAEWVEHELHGYKKGDAVPSYRITENASVIYTGVNGNFQVANQPLPLKEILGSEYKELFQVPIKDGVKTLEDTVNDVTHRTSYRKDITAMAGTVYKRSGIKCFSITFLIAEGEIANIINNIKTKLLKIYMQLEREYGCLDELDINISGTHPDEVSQVNYTIINYNYNNNSVSMGDKNKIEKSKLLEWGETDDEQKQ